MKVGTPSDEGVAQVTLRADMAKFNEKKALETLNESWPGSKVLR